MSSQSRQEHHFLDHQSFDRRRVVRLAGDLFNSTNKVFVPITPSTGRTAPKESLLFGEVLQHVALWPQMKGLDGLVSLREASTPHAAQRREALQTQLQGLFAFREDEFRGHARPVLPNHAFENPNQEP